MPDDVRNALQTIMQEQGGKTVEEAELYIRELDRTHRYQAETWS